MKIFILNYLIKYKIFRQIFLGQYFKKFRRVQNYRSGKELYFQTGFLFDIFKIDNIKK